MNRRVDCRYAATIALSVTQMVEFGAAAAVVSALKGANKVEDWILAEGAAWAMEIMAGFSRRLTRDFGWGPAG